MRNPDDSPNIFWEIFGPRPDLARTFWVKISFKPDDNPNILCSSVVGKVLPESFTMRK